MPRLLLSCCLLSSLVGCLVPPSAPPPVYRMQRTARAPQPVAPLHTGQPLRGPVELAWSTSTALARAAHADPARDVDVSQLALRGELRVRVNRAFSIAAIHERSAGSAGHTREAAADTAARASTPVGPAPLATRGAPHGSGLALRYAIPLDGRLTLGIDLEVVGWTLPVATRVTCIRNCERAVDTGDTHETIFELLPGGAITPSYRIGRLTAFGGLYLRAHPDLGATGTWTSEDRSTASRPGDPPLTVLLHAGAAYRFRGGLSVLVAASQSVVSEPTAYGPSLTAGLELALR